MTSSWPFAWLWFYFLSLLGLTFFHGALHLRPRRAFPWLLHGVTFLLLLTATFGQADKQRVRLVLEQGVPTNQGLRDGVPVTLPFTVTLQRFQVDEYPPELYVIDPASGQSVKLLSLTGGGTSASCGPWSITVTDFLAMALPDSSSFRPLRHVGAAPAAHIRALHRPSGRQVEGWVACGSFLFEGRSLELDEHTVLALPRPAPKRFVSDIELTEAGKSPRSLSVAVNHPARSGHWHLYQADYDAERGSWSTTSTLECVSDRWWPLVRLLCWLLLGLALGGGFVMRAKRKEDRRQ